MSTAKTKKGAAVTKAKPVAQKAGKAAASAKPVKAVAQKAPPRTAVKAKPPVKSAAKPAVKTATKTAAKPAAKKPSPTPAKKTTAAKPAAAKPTSAVKTPAPQKAGTQTASKPLAKKPAPAAKTTPSKAKGKPVPAQAKPASKVAAKPAPKAAPTIVKNSPSHTAKAPVAKAAPGKAPAPASKAAPARPAPAPAPIKALPAVGKQSPRAAKAASMVPPPPAAVVPSRAAKSSYSPIITPTHIPAAPVNTHKDPKLANHWKTKPLESLTDADLMAMPDDEYMNSVQLAYFRRKLVELKQDILNNAGETTEHLREDTTVVPDPADRATIEEEHALELRTRDRERKLLKKIEQSIGRIDSEDYGYCDETGESIGVGRLLARPTATLSLEAQQRRELKQKNVWGLSPATAAPAAPTPQQALGPVFLRLKNPHN
jgi:DnaK suppressor protein